MGIISWLILGLLAGILAKWIVPGKESGGFIATTLLGVAGSMVGGFVGSLLGIGATQSLSIGGVVTAVLGAVLLILIYKKFFK